MLVELAYQIDPADEPAFYQAMQAMRGVRLRDGAFRWSLYQDLVRPGEVEVGDARKQGKDDVQRCGIGHGGLSG